MKTSFAIPPMLTGTSSSLVPSLPLPQSPDQMSRIRNTGVPIETLKQVSTRARAAAGGSWTRGILRCL